MITEFSISNMIQRGKSYDQLSLDIILAPRNFMFTEYYVEFNIKKEVNDQKNDRVKQHLILWASHEISKCV